LIVQPVRRAFTHIASFPKITRPFVKQLADFSIEQRFSGSLPNLRLKKLFIAVPSIHEE